LDLVIKPVIALFIKKKGYFSNPANGGIPDE
jgi:hypothetical protein